MHSRSIFLLSAASLTAAALLSAETPKPTVLPSPSLPACDSSGFLKAAMEAEQLRVKRRVSAEDFAKMAREPGTIVLDARSAAAYEKLRIKGSINLPYTEMAAASLARLIPTRNTRILIYCRNNLLDIPQPKAHPGASGKPSSPKKASNNVPIVNGIPIIGRLFQSNDGTTNNKDKNKTLSVIKDHLYPAEFDPPEIPKSPPAGLNIPTYITLYIYGYNNVWELDPAVDPNDSVIEFESSPSANTTGATSDSAGFLTAAAQAEQLRVKRRISAEVFAEMARDSDTIVLDARSRESFEKLRIKGSINLPLTDMAAATLAQTIPDKGKRILIYCRNNLAPQIFPVTPARPVASSPPPQNATGVDLMKAPTVRTGKATIEVIREFVYPTEFDPPKIPTAGLNISTFITLYQYGYSNVWELDPAVDPAKSVITFETGAPSAP